MAKFTDEQLEAAKNSTLEFLENENKSSPASIENMLECFTSEMKGADSFNVQIDVLNKAFAVISVIGLDRQRVPNKKVQGEQTKKYLNAYATNSVLDAYATFLNILEDDVSPELDESSCAKWKNVGQADEAMHKYRDATKALVEDDAKRQIHQDARGQFVQRMAGGEHALTHDPSAQDTSTHDPVLRRLVDAIRRESPSRVPIER